MSTLVTPRQAIANEREAAARHLAECQLAFELAQHSGEDLGMHELEIDLAETRVYRAGISKVLVSVLHNGKRCQVIGIDKAESILTVLADGAPLTVAGSTLDPQGFVFEDFDVAPAVVPAIATEETGARFAPVSTPAELAMRSQIAAMELGAMLENLGRTPQAEAPKSWFELYVDEERAPIEPQVIRPHIDAARRMNTRGGWASVADAIAWVHNRKAPTAWFRIAEYMAGEGGDERVGGCALDEAEEGKYTSLVF